MPGTRQGDEAPPPQRHQGVPDRGYRIHNVNAYPQRPDRAYLGYMDGGAVILDTSNLGRMHMISQWDYHPPFEGMTHTVMPLFDRDLLIVCEERARAGDPDEQPMYMWVVDVREEPRPQSISICPPPNPADYGKRPGWYGPHNIFENDTLPTAWFSDKFIFAAMFNAGLRVYDISNPFRPEEVAYYVPPAPEGADSIRINDVYVDEKGLVYAADRVKGGIYILEMQF